jgi:hypothetical protein
MYGGEDTQEAMQLRQPTTKGTDLMVDNFSEFNFFISMTSGEEKFACVD